MITQEEIDTALRFLKTQGDWAADNETGVAHHRTAYLIQRLWKELQERKPK